MPVAQNTVLIIDDEPDFRALVNRRLKTAGYDTLEACDGQDAIDILRVESPDLILLDINMPKVNGYEVLNWIKNNKVLKTSVMIVTGESQRDHVVSSLTLGAKDFLVKSAGSTEFLRRINRLCQTKRLVEQNDYEVTEAELHASPILIVDDQELSLELTSRRLEKAGFSVCKASNAEQAWKILEAQPIHLALLDVNMPDVDGHDLLQQLMNSKYKDSLAIIMVSAVDGPDMVIDCIRDGADDYIMKPYHQSELIMRVQTTLYSKLISYKAYIKRRTHEELAKLGKQLKEP